MPDKAKRFTDSSVVKTRRDGKKAAAKKMAFSNRPFHDSFGTTLAKQEYLMYQVARAAKPIGASLRRGRRALGLRQDDVGDKSNLRQATIAQEAKPTIHC